MVGTADLQVVEESLLERVQRGGTLPDRAAIEVVPTIRQRVMGTADAAEGIASFVERRTAVFQGR